MTETTTSVAKDLLYFGHDFDGNGRNNALLQENFIDEIKQKHPRVRLKDSYDRTKDSSR